MAAPAPLPLLSAASVAAVAAVISGIPLLLPTAASASGSSGSSVLASMLPHTLQQHQHWEVVMAGYTAAGAASLLVSLVCTSRFLLS